MAVPLLCCTRMVPHTGRPYFLRVPFRGRASGLLLALNFMYIANKRNLCLRNKKMHVTWCNDLTIIETAYSIIWYVVFVCWRPGSSPGKVDMQKLTVATSNGNRTQTALSWNECVEQHAKRCHNNLQRCTLHLTRGRPEILMAYTQLLSTSLEAKVERIVPLVISLCQSAATTKKTGFSSNDHPPPQLEGSLLFLFALFISVCVIGVRVCFVSQEYRRYLYPHIKANDVT